MANDGWDDPTRQQQAGGGGGTGQMGYSGLGGILDLLRGLGTEGGSSMNQAQYDAMMAGHVGGGHGNMHGFGRLSGGGNVLDGLSKYGAHWLAQNYLQKIAPTLASTTGLTGDALFNANMGNTFANAAPARYQAAHGLDLDTIAGYLSHLGDLSGRYHGHSAYRKHHNATS